MDKIDSIDRKIITILEKNSRIANTEIAKRLSISEATVRNRIGKLIEHKIIKNVSVVNPKTLGYQIHVIIGVQVDLRKIKEIAEKFEEMDAIYFVGYSTGRYDLILVAFFQSTEEQYQFLTQDLSTIDGIIRTETSNILKMAKTRHVWGISLEK